MEKNKLISTTDFVLQQDTERFSDEVMNEVHNYASFLKKPLTISIFVPVDNDGNVFNYPDRDYYRSTYDCAFHNYKWNKHYLDAIKNYNLAKEKVLFEGFSYNQETLTLYHGNTPFWIGSFDGFTIEDGMDWLHNHKLTPTAIKQIYG